MARDDSKMFVKAYEKTVMFESPHETAILDEHFIKHMQAFRNNYKTNAFVSKEIVFHIILLMTM